MLRPSNQLGREQRCNVLAWDDGSGAAGAHDRRQAAWKQPISASWRTSRSSFISDCLRTSVAPSEVGEDSCGTQSARRLQSCQQLTVTASPSSRCSGMVPAAAASISIANRTPACLMRCFAVAIAGAK